MPSPAGLIAADVSDLEAVVVGASVFERLQGDPAGFVFALLSEGEELFGLSESAFDFGRVRGSFFLLRDVLDDRVVVVLICLLNANEREFMTARAETCADRIAFGTDGADFKGRFAFAFWFIGVERPLAIIIREAVESVVVDGVDNDSDLARIVRVGSHSAHSLLDKKREGFGRAG